MRSLLATAVLLLLLLLLAGCTEWLFAGERGKDRSRPVVLVETTGGVELGATTEYGILTLGRTATAGACRVHYFLGPTPMIDDGELEATTSAFTRVEIELATQRARVLDRDLQDGDELLVMWTPDGTTTETVDVTLARRPDIEGDVLTDPGVALPTGATVLRYNDRDEFYDFVGLVAGKAVIDQGPNRGSWYVFAGTARMRELLAIPEKHPVDYEPRYRPDGITVLKPIK